MDGLDTDNLDALLRIPPNCCMAEFGQSGGCGCCRREPDGSKFHAAPARDVHFCAGETGDFVVPTFPREHVAFRILRLHGVERCLVGLQFCLAQALDSRLRLYRDGGRHVD